MKGETTVVIIGAGASACYEDGDSPIATQLDILKSLISPKISASSGKGAPSLITTRGMKYSYFLGEYIRKKYNLPQEEGEEATAFWENLHKKGFTLEIFYDDLEHDGSIEGQRALFDFKAIIRSKIADATGERRREKVCRFHRKLVRALEPKDFIVDFNWDTVIDDALLYESPYWHPLTGYGIPFLGWQGDFNNKHFPIQSHINLFHIHGSIALYEPANQEKSSSQEMSFLIGPEGYSTVNVLVDLMEIAKEDIAIARSSGIQPKPKRDPTKRELDLWEHGYIWIPEKKCWFQPIFIPPSKTKPEYKNWYAGILRKKILSQLPFAQHILIIGYSFPQSDYDHLRFFFVQDIIQEDTKVTCINLANDDPNYQIRAKNVFPKQKFNFSIHDFKYFCESL